MSIQTVFSGAGGGQVFLYEAYSAGTYVDTMGVGSDFEQPNSGNRPTANTSIAPSGATMLSFDGNDLVGDFGTGGIVDDADMPAWGGIFVEHFILYFLSTPNNVDEMRLIDQGGGSWGRNQFGAGIIYRADALSDAAMSVSTPYFVTIEHNAATAVSTMTVNGVAQSDTGGNWDGMRDDFLGYKLIGAQGDLSKGLIGCFGCYGLGHATTWGSTERAALDAAMDEWWSGGGGGGGEVDFAATSAGVATASAQLSVARRFAASAAGVASAQAAARVVRSFGAPSSGIAAASAQLAVARRLQAASAGQAAASLALRVVRPFSGSAQGEASAAASLAVTRAFAATSAGVASADARLRVVRAFAGSAAGVASAAVALTVGHVNEVLFSASAAGTSTATASLSVARRFTASAQAVATAGMALRVVRRFVAPSTSVAVADARLSVVRSFAATSAGFATAVADLSLGSDSPDLPPGISTAEPFAVVATVRVYPSSGQVVVERAAGTIRIGGSS
jgi:hypothetical protein